MSFWNWLFGRASKEQPFLDSWRPFLEDKVQFYRSLSEKKKQEFETRIMRFLNTTKITGILTEVADEDRLLIASGAVIPIFAFPKWEYHNLQEVLLYPAHFDFDFSIGEAAKNAAILGMVGYGYMEGKMVISKKALEHGFSNEEDKRNTIVHEFIHLIDKMDGKTDGIMVFLSQREYVIPWLQLMDKTIEEIRNSESGIDPYGGTNREEFLAVVSEYFFERPDLLKKKHPEIYRYLSLMFGQKLADTKLVERSHPTRSNDPCPCGSGKKFKDCCKKGS